VGLSTSAASVLWITYFHSAVFSAPAIVGDTVLIGNSRGDLVAYRPALRTATGTIGRRDLDSVSPVSCCVEVFGDERTGSPAALALHCGNRSAWVSSSSGGSVGWRSGDDHGNDDRGFRADGAVQDRGAGPMERHPR